MIQVAYENEEENQLYYTPIEMRDSGCLLCAYVTRVGQRLMEVCGLVFRAIPSILSGTHAVLMQIQTL